MSDNQEIQVLDNPVTPEHVTIQDRLIAQVIGMLQSNPLQTAYSQELGIGNYTPDCERITLKVGDKLSLMIWVYRSKS